MVKRIIFKCIQAACEDATKTRKINKMEQGAYTLLWCRYSNCYMSNNLFVIYTPKKEFNFTV